MWWCPADVFRELVLLESTCSTWEDGSSGQARAQDPSVTLAAETETFGLQEKDTGFVF